MSTIPVSNFARTGQLKPKNATPEQPPATPIAPLPETPQAVEHPPTGALQPAEVVAQSAISQAVEQAALATTGPESLTIDTQFAQANAKMNRIIAYLNSKSGLQGHNPHTWLYGVKHADGTQGLWPLKARLDSFDQTCIPLVMSLPEQPPTSVAHIKFGEANFDHLVLKLPTRQEMEKEAAERQVANAQQVNRIAGGAAKT